MCSLDFMHLSLDMKPQLELSLSVHYSMIGKDKLEFVFRIQNVCDVIPGVEHLPSVFMLIPGALPAGWAWVLLDGLLVHRKVTLPGLKIIFGRSPVKMTGQIHFSLDMPHY